MKASKKNNDKCENNIKRNRYRVMCLLAATLACSTVSLILWIYTIVVVSEINNIVSTSQNEIKHLKVDVNQLGTMITPEVYHLGEKEVPGRATKVQGYAFLHHSSDSPYVASLSRKISNINYNASHATSQCYGFLTTGSRWKVTEPWILNPSNIHNMSMAFLMTAVQSGVTEWDSYVQFSLFGSGSADFTTFPLLTSPDGLNVVAFGEINSQYVVAVTFTWGIFTGPVAQRELIEWDMIFDQVDYVWGNASINPNIMDVQNTLTHELGHAIGLSDLTNSACSEQTMFGTTSAGEIKKRTIDSGDINGLQILYEETLAGEEPPIANGNGKMTLLGYGERIQMQSILFALLIIFCL